MSWSTIYINGKEGFKEAVEGRLDDTWLQGNTETGPEQLMYWLPEDTDLRDFKLAIGSKIIFKYRLHFFSSVDELQLQAKKNQNSGLTEKENRMVRKMVNWEKKKRQQRLQIPKKGQKV